MSAIVGEGGMKLANPVIGVNFSISRLLDTMGQNQ